MSNDAARTIEPAGEDSRTDKRRVGKRKPPAALLLIALVPLFLAVSWIVYLERTLPDVRAPRAGAESQQLPGLPLIPPGNHSISDVPTESSGDWILQEVGDAIWLATDQQGARQRLAFYGSEVHLIVRIGPDAGRAYITVNDRHVDSLPTDDVGSFIGLWAARATNTSVLLASGLAHGEHVVDITAAGDGEVAVAGIEVVAQTPFPWAFALAYFGLGGGIFIILRTVLIALSRSEGSSEPSHDPERVSGA